MECPLAGERPGNVGDPLEALVPATGLLKYALLAYPFGDKVLYGDVGLGVNGGSAVGEYNCASRCCNDMSSCISFSS